MILIWPFKKKYVRVVNFGQKSRKNGVKIELGSKNFWK